MRQTKIEKLIYFHYDFVEEFVYQKALPFTFVFHLRAFLIFSDARTIFRTEK
jgi:hypothetical protein